MINLDDNDYRCIAEKLLSAIDCSEYYNGLIEYETGEYGAIFRTTLIIYREPVLDPVDTSQNATRITEIVPVWWEFHTYDCYGEQLNGFSWRELKKYLV